VNEWDEHMGAVIGVKSPGQGSFSVADPRTTGPRSTSNEFRIVQWDRAAQAVTSAHGSGQAVADPRSELERRSAHGKLHVTGWDERTGAVIRRARPGQGAHGCRGSARSGPFEGAGKYRVTGFDEPAGTVIARSDTGQGAFAVADPRPNMNRAKGDHYLTGGHYGVVPWDRTAYAVAARPTRQRPLERRGPAAHARACGQAHRAHHGARWHVAPPVHDAGARRAAVAARPRGLVGAVALDGESDQAWRERIGNAVPPDAAQAIAEVMGETLLLAMTGETFMLSSRPVWVRPLAIAIACRGRDR
jgi:site-specific DNA-cytosine methylase